MAMTDETLNTIRHIGVAVKFFGFGAVGGLYISNSQFRYPYVLVLILIFGGECARVWAKRQIIQRNNKKTCSKEAG